MLSRLRGAVKRKVGCFFDPVMSLTPARRVRGRRIDPGRPAYVELCGTLPRAGAGDTRRAQRIRWPSRSSSGSTPKLFFRDAAHRSGHGFPSRSCPSRLKTASCVRPFTRGARRPKYRMLCRLYARRQPTLSAHLERVREHLGLTAFDEKARQRLAPFVFKEAFRLEQGAALVSRCEEYLRGQRPPLRRVPAQPLQSRAKGKA